MPLRDLEHDDALEDFEHREVALLGETRTVHVAGAGPAVVIMTEMPGISPRVARFARWVRDAGLTAWMPHLFGRDGAFPTASEGRRVFARACVSQEFRSLAANESDLTVLAYRFEGDASCRAERFAAYQHALGNRFVARVLPDHAAGPRSRHPDDFFQLVPTPHSVVTVHLVDEDGQPTAAARDEILAFFRHRLLGALVH